MRIVAATLLVVVLGVSGSAQDWPSFRGPGAAGIAEVGALPTTWDVAKGDRVRWRRDLPGLSHASPVVWGDRIYAVTSTRVTGSSIVSPPVESVVFADDTVEHRWTLYAIDRRTGAIVWERTAASGVPRQPRHVRGTYANATPATNGAFVVLSLGYEGLVCFDRQGTLRWRQPGPEDHKAMLDPASSPVIHDDLVIVQNDWQRGGHLAAYDLSSGKEAWRVARNEGMAWTSPSVIRRGNGAELVTNGREWIRAFDPRTGRELWRLNNTAKDTWDRVPTPFASGDLTIVAGGGGERPVYAIRAGASGDITPSGSAASPALAWTVDRGSPYLCTPLVYRGVLYILASNGVVALHDAATGERLSQQRLSSGVGFSASPVGSGGHVYFTNDDGDVTVVRAGRAFEIAGRNRLGAMTFATPAVTPGALIFRTVTGLVAIG